MTHVCMPHQVPTGAPLRDWPFASAPAHAQCPRETLHVKGHVCACLGTLQDRPRCAPTQCTPAHPEPRPGHPFQPHQSMASGLSGILTRRESLSGLLCARARYMHLRGCLSPAMASLPCRTCWQHADMLRLLRVQSVRRRSKSSHQSSPHQHANSRAASLASQSVTVSYSPPTLPSSS